MKRPLRIAITTGEPAGIGPEIAVAAAAVATDAELILLADRDLLAERARCVGVSLPIHDWQPQTPGLPHPALWNLHEPLDAPCVAGTLDPRNGRYVLRLLDRALAGVAQRDFDAIVTAPVQKSVINDAGVAFSGHTEYLAERLGGVHPVMLLAAENLRVALVTTHLPLARVPSALSTALIERTLAILDHDVRRLWGIQAPRIGVCGLNPHAGESGHLGMEEIEIIAPAIAQARGRGIAAHGPLPADTIFTPRALEAFDVVLAMYHDQGLPVLKHAGFGHAVNITLGLPIIRTSVDHGTALSLAGTGKADAGSLQSAIAMAIDFARRARAGQAP